MWAYYGLRLATGSRFVPTAAEDVDLAEAFAVLAGRNLPSWDTQAALFASVIA